MLEFRIPASRAQCARFSLRAMRKPPPSRTELPVVENPLPPPVEISTASSPLRRYTRIRVEESGLGDKVREHHARAYAFVEEPINKTMDKVRKVYQLFTSVIGLREHSSSLRVESANMSIHLRGRGAWPNPPPPAVHGRLPPEHQHLAKWQSRALWIVCAPRSTRVSSCGGGKS